MILADTSIWVDHLHGRSTELRTLIRSRRMVMHPVVLGELICGNLPERARTVESLFLMPRVPMLELDAAADFVERYRLFGLGLSWSDVHLLASCDEFGVRLLTRDATLATVARRLRISK